MPETSEKKARPKPVRPKPVRPKTQNNVSKHNPANQVSSKRRPKPVRPKTQNNVSKHNPANPVSSKRRPKPVRPKTQNNVSIQRAVREEASKEAAVSIKEIIAQRRANKNAIKNLNRMRVKNNITLKERKKLDQKKQGTSLNSIAMHEHFKNSKMNAVDMELLKGMEKHIPKGYTPDEIKTWTQFYKMYLKEEIAKRDPQGRPPYRRDRPPSPPGLPPGLPTGRPRSPPGLPPGRPLPRTPPSPPYRPPPSPDISPNK